MAGTSGISIISEENEATSEIVTTTQATAMSTGVDTEPYTVPQTSSSAISSCNTRSGRAESSCTYPTAGSNMTHTGRTGLADQSPAVPTSNYATGTTVSFSGGGERKSQLATKIDMEGSADTSSDTHSRKQPEILVATQCKYPWNQK